MMPGRHNRLLLYRGVSVFLVISAICVGCGKKATPQPTLVSGYVTFRGQPLSGGTIVFIPDRERGTSGKLIAATIAADGGYKLSAASEAGISPGWYRIAISDPADAGSGLFQGFPEALRRPDLSGLEREVKVGQNNILDFLIELAE